MVPSNEYLTEYVSTVTNIARNYHRTLPKWFQLQDLISEGMLGLIEASSHFNKDLGVPLIAYASRRILGAMQDYVKSHDTMSRSERQESNAERSLGLEYMKVQVIPYSDNPFESGDTSDLPDIFSRKASRPDAVAITKLELQRIQSALTKDAWLLLVWVQIDGLTFLEISSELKLPQIKIVQLYNAAMLEARSVALAA